MKRFLKKILTFLILFLVLLLLLSRCEATHKSYEVNPETITRTPEEYEAILEEQVQGKRKVPVLLNAYAEETTDILNFEDDTTFIPTTSVMSGLGLFFDVLDYTEPINAGVQTVTLNTSYCLSGKHKFIYSDDTYEVCTLTISLKDIGEGLLGTAVLERTGSAGSTSYTYDITSAGVSIGSNYTEVVYTCYDTSGNRWNRTSGFKGDTVNSVITSNHSGVLSATNLLNYYYSEVYFISNDYAKKLQHDTVFTNNNWWSRPSISYPISSGTTIDTTNVNDYSIYGFGVGSDGNLTFDYNTFLAYNENDFLPLFMSEYEKIYNNFPDIGVEYPDEGGNRNNLIVVDKDDTELVPVATLPAHWFEDTAQLNTDPEIYLNTYDADKTDGLFNDSKLDTNVIENTGGLISFASDILKDNGLLPLVLFGVVISIIFAFLKF